MRHQDVPGAQDEETAMPKILIITGDAAESLEVMYPYQRLLEEGYEVHIAAPSVKKLQFIRILRAKAPA
jgi:hypothetical protein